MKNSILSSTLAVILCGPLAFASMQAQPPAAPPPDQSQSAPIVRTPNPHQQAERMARTLNLTPDQTAKLEPILADRDSKIAALRSNTALSPQDQHHQMHAIQRDAQQQISQILTPAQLDQMKTLHQEHEGHGRNGQPETPPTPPPSN